MEADIDQVFAAIYTLYNDQAHGDWNKREQVQKASEWLEQLQKTVQAWNIADQILHMKRDVNSCFFAAQTLRTKIQFHFVELPQDAHESLRASVLEHLSHITEDTYQGIATQLCVAMADLALLMSAWEDPIGDLTKQFGPGSASPNVVPLLEVLIALPEEQLSRHLRLGLNRRAQLDEYFKAQVPNIIRLLHVVIGAEATSTSEGKHLKALRCLGSWFNIHTPDWAELTSTCILPDLLGIVRNPQVSPRLHEIGTDCICSAMIMLEGQRIPGLATALFGEVLQLEDAYHMAVALEDLTAVTNYARMFAELGETLVEIIINQSNENTGSLQVLHLLLTCVGHHEWEVAEITFNFWYKVSEVVYRKNCNKVNTLLKPYIERLIEALCRHCQIDSDHEGLLMEHEDFYEFRERVQELVKDVAFICESKSCFMQMSRLIQDPETLKHWNHLEAALFIMQCVAKNLVPEENEVVPPILEGVLSQPEGIHVQVAFTSLLFLAELNEWLSCHPVLIPPVLTFLTKRLHNPYLATATAKALYAVCQSCTDHIDEHFEGLMMVVSSVDSFSISNEAVIGLLKGVASILSRLPPDKISSHIKKLCGLQVGNLQRLLQEKKAIEHNSPSDPVIWLDRLSAIFRNVNPTVKNGEKHPCQEVVMEIWPVLSATFQYYSSDVKVMEHCCKCLRFAVRCVHKQSAPLLQPLVELIVSLYGERGYSCFLYLGSILVDVYGTDPSCTAGLFAMLQAFVQPTFSILTQPSGFKNHPETVDDWFRLCSRFMNRVPVQFLQHAEIGSILECGLQACLLDHKDANETVMKFFQDLLDVGMLHDERPDFETRRALVEQIMEAHGQALVNNLVTVAVFILPTYMLHEVAETFFQMMKFNRVKFCHWLEVKLKNLPRQNSCGGEAVTTSQLVELHKTITKAERTKEITRALNDFRHYFI